MSKNSILLITNFIFSLLLSLQSYAQQTKENLERRIAIMEANGELRKEGNKLIFLNVNEGDTAFYTSMYRQMLNKVKDNPYTFSFEFKKNKNTTKNKVAKDSNTATVFVSPVNRTVTTLDYTRVSFNTSITTTVVNPASPLQFQNIENNDGNSFSLSNSTFKAPVDGLYFFALVINWNGYCGWSVGGSASVSLLKNSRTSIWSTRTQTFSPEDFSTQFSCSVKLKMGDEIKVQFTNMLCDHGGTFPQVYSAKFSGYKIY
jgi:hypothetical protein